MPTKDELLPSHPRGPYDYPGKIPETIIESITYLVLRPPVTRSAIHISAPTYTSDVKLVDANVIWANAAVTFTAVRLSITDSASQAASQALDIRVGGSSILALRKDGSLTTPLKVAAIPANTTNFLISGGSLTGTSTGPLIDWSGTLSTSGLARGFRLNLTNTGSAVGSPVFDVQLSTISFLRVETLSTSGASGRVVVSGGLDVRRAGTAISFFQVTTGGAGSVVISTLGISTTTITFFLSRAAGGNYVAWDANGDATFFRHITGSTLTGTALVGGSLSATSGLFSSTLTANIGATFGTAVGVDLALRLRAANQFTRYIIWETGTSQRWVLGAGSDDETGSDAGSPLGIWAYDDSGIQIDNVMLMTRAAGSPIVFGRNLTTPALVTDQISLLSAGFLTFDNPSAWLSFSDKIWLRDSFGGEIHHNDVTSTLLLYAAGTSNAKLSLGTTDSVYRADTHSFEEEDTTPIISLTATLLAPATSSVVALGSGSARWGDGFLTTLSLAQGTITAPATALSITVTWNDAADTFTAIDLNVTDTASAAASTLLNLRVGGTTRFNVTKAGIGTFASDLNIQGTGVVLGVNDSTSANFTLNAATATLRQILFQTAGSNRWIVRVGTDAESGSDAGAPLFINARTDAGASIDNVVSFTRAAGGPITLARPLITLASASARAGFRVPHGTAPSSPVDGDFWSTTAGAFIRINGTTKTFTLT